MRIPFTVRLPCVLLGSTLLLPGTLAADPHAQQKPHDQYENQQRNQQRDTQQDDQQQLDQKDVQTFRGKVSQKWSRFFLEDPLKHMSYQLDDPRLAKPYVGQTVRVTGILDEDRNIIHVRAIVKAS
jgi:hypothetical protein